jgi:uracil-DNA glycosylase
MTDKIHKSWKKLFDKYDFNLDELYNSGEDIVYPPKELIFRVFSMNVKKIRVVLLGQDPYHNPNQANGLSFSVPENIKIPPSLQNIYKELCIEFPERNYEFNSGNLERWFVEEKIFLLNSSLTVVKNKPNSHMNIWSEFTDDVISYISKKNKDCIFILLGNFAKSKEKFIENKDNIITGIHPSPFSAYNGFFNSNIFKKVEEKLGREINWNI